MFRHPALCLSLLLLTATAPATAAIKCWTNHQGVRECGNVVPPEYSQQRTRTVNERGITVEVQERAKTAEEVAAEERRARDEVEERKRAEERARAQAERDRVLIGTFTTEEELLASRDRKLTALEATIEVTGLSIDSLQKSMEGYKKKAADIERSGKPVPEALTRDIANLQKQIDNKRAYVGNKQKEMEALREQYARDLLRFRELMQTKAR